MKKTYVLILCIFNFYQFVAQTITGKILDETNSPMHGVSVYFDGTTIGTTTDSDGFFELKLQSLPNATFVISYIGYESVYLNSIQSPLELKLKPSSIVLNEVVLEPIPFSRKEMLAVFREQFLGKTKGGRNCVILNEDAIQFSYESKNFKLSAFSNEKISIKNYFLGYTIEIELVDFFVQYNKRTLSNDFLRSSYFAITSFFKEMEETEKSYDKNRMSAFLGSPKHFFKNLIEKKWGKNEFILFDGSFPTQADLHFEISDVQSMKLIKVKAKQVTSNFKSMPKFVRSFNLLFNNKKQSKIIFKTAEFYVDSFGNHTHIDQIDFTGEISKKRFGDMLPLDFVLN
jgi:hypothetical protein